MGISEHDRVRRDLLIEGLMATIDLGWIHNSFMFENHKPKRPVREAQELTLDMIRELVSEGLFVLGLPAGTRKDPTIFHQWDIPLDDASPRSRRPTSTTSMIVGRGNVWSG